MTTVHYKKSSDTGCPVIRTMLLITQLAYPWKIDKILFHRKEGSFNGESKSSVCFHIILQLELFHFHTALAPSNESCNFTSPDSLNFVLEALMKQQFENQPVISGLKERNCVFWVTRPYQALTNQPYFFLLWAKGK